MTICNLSISALSFKPSNLVSEGGKIIGLSRLADYLSLNLYLYIILILLGL